MNGQAGVPRSQPATSDAFGPLADPPHDVPSARDLVCAVEQFLREDVMPTSEGLTRFHLRVAANVLAMVARQLELGPAQAAAHAARLAALGVADDRQLAEAIRSGALADRLDEVTAAVRDSVADKLSVANPSYISPLPESGS